MQSPLNPLRFNDLFGGVAPEWQRQSAFIDLLIQAAMTAMSIIATQLPNIQAAVVRTGPIATSSNVEISAERHNSEIKHRLPPRQESKPQRLAMRNCFAREIQSKLDTQPTFMFCWPISRRTIELTGRGDHMKPSPHQSN
jgi:hypothetical protein